MKVQLLIATPIGLALANPLVYRQAGGGDGPFRPARYTTESSLPLHTIYLPNSASIGSTSLPVLVWGNGGCGGDGLSNQKFLEQVASYGYLAISSGAPKGTQGTTAAMMKQSIDWVHSNAGRAGTPYANVDKSKIMAAGFSCGGVEAYAQIWDDRVKTVGIFSSGLLQNTTAARDMYKPILYVLGGSGDIAYANGERDFKALPANTPAWKGNLPVGHGGTLFDANGGKFGRAGLFWLEWLFKGNETAGRYFTADGYRADGWVVETRGLNNLKPFVK